MTNTLALISLYWVQKVMCGLLQVFLIRHIVQIPARWWGWEPVLIHRSNSIYYIWQYTVAQKSKKNLLLILLDTFKKSNLIEHIALQRGTWGRKIKNIYTSSTIFRALCQNAERNFFAPVFITLHSIQWADFDLNKCIFFVSKFC